MATKPSTWPTPWCTNAVYTTGPFIGSPGKVAVPGAVAAEGHRPGALFPTAAEYENYNSNLITTALTDWVRLGSSAGAPDAHICETDSDGEGQVERWRVVPANPSSYALFVQAPPNAGFAIQAAGGSLLGDATIIGLTTGPGAAVEGVSGTTGACFVATPSGSGAGFSCTVGGTGQAINVIGGTGATAATIAGGTGQSGMLVSSGNNGAVAAQFLGAGTALGIVASGGATSSGATGVRGDALHADAVGVHGRTSVSPSALAAGVTGEARGAGASGVHANGGTVGRGLLVRADTSPAPAYSAMRIIPQSADPSAATQDGEVIWHADHKTLRTSVAGYGYRSFPAMGPGSALIVNATNTAADGVAGGGLYNDVITATCSTSDGTGVYGQAAGAEVYISVSFDVRQTIGGSTNTVNVGLIDVTNGGADIARWEGSGILSDSGFFMSDDGVLWQRTITCNVRYPFPSDGDLEVKLEVGGEGSALQVRNVSLTVMGTF